MKPIAAPPGALVAVVAAAALLQPLHASRIALASGALAAIFAYRMYRFGVRFAREPPHRPFAKPRAVAVS